MKTILTHAKKCKALWYVDIDGQAAGIIHTCGKETTYNGEGKPGKTKTFIEALEMIEKQFKAGAM